MSSKHDACHERSTEKRKLQKNSSVTLGNLKPSKVRERAEFEDVRELLVLCFSCVVEILIGLQKRHRTSRGMSQPTISPSIESSTSPSGSSQPTSTPFAEADVRLFVTLLRFF
jgi:hypothetical protein